MSLESMKPSYLARPQTIKDIVVIVLMTVTAVANQYGFKCQAVCPRHHYRHRKVNTLPNTHPQQLHDLRPHHPLFRFGSISNLWLKNPALTLARS